MSHLTDPAVIGSIAIGFPVLFAGVWAANSTLLALLVGHPTALSQYPPQEDELLQSFTFASARGPRMVNFSGALYVGIGRRGLHLAPNGLFRPPWWWGIPCIPWREVVVEGEERSFFMRGVRVSIPTLGLSWLIYGIAGRAILTHAH